MPGSLKYTRLGSGDFIALKVSAITLAICADPADLRPYITVHRRII